MPHNDEISVWLKKGVDIIHVRAVGYKTDQGFCQIDATCDLHDLKFKRLGTLYAIQGPYEREVRELQDLGWVEVKKRGRT
jgi:hypothetical protein